MRFVEFRVREAFDDLLAGCVDREKEMPGFLGLLPPVFAAPQDDAVERSDNEAAVTARGAGVVGNEQHGLGPYC